MALSATSVLSLNSFRGSGSVTFLSASSSVCLFFAKNFFLVSNLPWCSFKTMSSCSVTSSLGGETHPLPGYNLLSKIWRAIMSPELSFFSSLNNPSSLNCFSQDICSTLFTSSIALFRSHSSTSVSFLKWGTQNWHSRCGLACADYRGEALL